VRGRNSSHPTYLRQVVVDDTKHLADSITGHVEEPNRVTVRFRVVNFINPNAPLTARHILNSDVRRVGKMFFKVRCQNPGYRVITPTLRRWDYEGDVFLRKIIGLRGSLIRLLREGGLL